MDNLTLMQNSALFLFSSAMIWYFCIKLSTLVDYVDYHYNLGSGFGGTLILSIVTNLPEIAITVSSSLKGDTSLAVGNLIGGIAIQTLLLVFFDFFNSKSTLPLSSLFGKKIALIQASILIVILGMVLLGTHIDAKFEMSIGFVIVAIWISGLFVIKKYQTPTPVSQTEVQLFEKQNPKKALMGLVFVSFIVLVFGVLLENTSSVIADGLNINGVIFGATVLALVTSLPELSSGISFVKNNSYEPIAGDIFGGNAFLPTLLLLAMVLSPNSVLTHSGSVNIYLSLVGILMTFIYLLGIKYQVQHKFFKLGLDSWIVLICFILSMIGLSTMA